MGILTSIVSSLGGEIVDRLLGRITGVFEAYFNKQISIEQLRTQVSQALLATFADVEKAYADSIARSFGALMDAATKSKDVARAWAFAVYSQLAVLLWHQLGIPALVTIVRIWSPHWNYPSSGATADWGYLLLGLLFGAGVMGLNAGPGAMPIDKLKSLVGR